MKLVLIILIFSFVFVNTVIASNKKPGHYKKIDYVDAIYWHENDRYTAVKIVNNCLVFIDLPESRHIHTTVMLDATDKPWYEYAYDFSSWNGVQVGGYMIIHIKSLGSFMTAGWNHGEFGNGITHRIDK